MAKIVAGFGSGHGPLMTLTPELWLVHGENDKRNRELVKPPDGRHLTYDQLLAEADPAIAKVINVETISKRVENIQRGQKVLKESFGQANPDVVVMFGDDQDEFFFEDNMPTINVYWGESIKLIPRKPPETASEAAKMSAAAYGTAEEDWPVDSELGLHLVESLTEADFDVSHSRYMKEEYGGTIGPATWYLDFKRETKPRRFGLPHAFSFPIRRWFVGKVPIVPITINTCYPPNWISPKRSYALGRAVREAILAWKSDKRVAIACSGGLSHFVVDEELDRLALKGMEEANGEILSSLPRVRLQSATTETLNWVAAAGAMGSTKMETLSYEPGIRTPAGTGCGCACGQWL